jgi:exodeoxyribonuclease VII small subunit
METNLTFENALEKLEVIVKELESGTTELDKAIDKYTEAMKLVKFCNDKLNSATEKVNKILTGNGELVDFNVEE